MMVATPYGTEALAEDKMKRIANHSTGIKRVPDKLRCREEIRPEALFSSFPAGAPGELRQPVVRLSAVPLNRSVGCRAFAPLRIPVSRSTPRDQKTGSASGATPAHRGVPQCCRQKLPAEGSATNDHV